MKITLQVFAVLVAIITGLSATKIHKCPGDDSPSIEDIKVTLGDCEDETPCVLNKGEKYNFELQFKASQNANNPELDVFVSVFKRLVQISSASDPDACESIQDSKGKKEACPLKEGQQYTYKKPIELSKNERTVTVNALWNLVDSNESITCFQIPIKIQDKPK